MHQVQLCFDHVTGKVKRKRGNQVVDDFPAAEGVRKRSWETANHLMDKKSKTRYKDFCEFMKSMGRTGGRIPMPNATRASGTYIHYEGMIKQRFN